MADPALWTRRPFTLTPSSRIGFRRSRTPPLLRTRRGVPGQDHVTDCTHGPCGHRQPLSRRDRASTPFPWLDHPPRGCRVPRPEPATGGTPTPPGVEFVRYTGSYGLGFRQTAPKTPRMAVRAVCRALGGHGGTWMAATRSARGTHPRTDSQARASSRPSSRLAVGRGSRRPGRRPQRGYARPLPPRRGSGGGAPRRPPLPWRAGNAGSEGAQPPASLRRGPTGCGPTE